MIVMSIAGVDPSGGAGILADIKTFQALGVYGTGIVTALTAQNPQRMYSLKVIETDYVEEHISKQECYIQKISSKQFLKKSENII